MTTTQNSWGSQNPAQVAKGGTGAATLTSHGVLLGNGTGAVTVTAEPSSGQILIGKTGDFPQLATITAGTGCSITNAAGSITIASTAGGATYEEVTSATKQMAVNYIYGAKRAGGVVFTLPATATKGDIIAVVGIQGIWSINQNASQTILYGNDTTTAGTAGSLASTVEGDCISIECIDTNTTFRATDGWGNFDSLPTGTVKFAANRGGRQVITTSGISNASGDNSSYAGGLGIGTATDVSLPTNVLGTFVQCEIGYTNSAWIDSNGIVWSSGANSSGQLGTYTTTATSSPVQVVGSHSFIQVALGQSSAYGLKANGEVWAWGSNSTNGELGDETKTNRSSPVLVHGNHSFIQVAAGVGVAYGLKANGECWAWGSGSFLGDYTTTSKSSPVLVVGEHSFIKISARNTSGCGGLKSNGDIWVWGTGTAGQMGNEANTSRSSPVLVRGSLLFIDLSIGSACGYGLRANGEVWAWGTGTAGALGNGIATTSSRPVLVIGSHSFKEISAGVGFCLARKSDNTLWGWGVNTSGQLGDGTLTSVSSPIQVFVS